MGSPFRAYLAEAIGAFALTLIGAGSICMDVATGGKVGLTGIALAHGLVIMTMAASLGHVSGGHFNPAVSFAMLVTRRQAPVQTALYVAAQLVGAALGGLLLARFVHNYQFAGNPPFLGACDLGNVGARAGVAIEAVLTFFLVLVIFGTAVDAKGAGTIAPIAIGLTVTLDILMGGPLTGAAMNPSRAFGPAIASGHWQNHFVYWLGPLLGGAGAGLLYDRFLMVKDVR